MDSVQGYGYKRGSNKEIIDFETGELIIKKKRTFEELNLEEKAESMRKRNNYYNEKRFELARILDLNYDENTKFLTLTFKENVTDVEKANYIFKKFIMRLKDYLKKHYNKELKYMATIEKQKRGAVHYHIVLMSFPYIKNVVIEKIWGQGYIKINKIKDSVDASAVGIYISKYFSKALEDKETYKNAYFCSKNLKKPIETKDYADEVELARKIEDLKDIENPKIKHVKEFEKIYYCGVDEKGQKIFEMKKFLYVVKEEDFEEKRKIKKTV